MKRSSFYCLAFFSPLFLAGCYDPDEFDMDRFDGTVNGYWVAAPFLEKRLSVQDLIRVEGGEVSTDESGLLHLIFPMTSIQQSFIPQGGLIQGVDRVEVDFDKDKFVHNMSSLLSSVEHSTIDFDISKPFLEGENYFLEFSLLELEVEMYNHTDRESRLTVRFPKGFSGGNVVSRDFLLPVGKSTSLWRLEDVVFELNECGVTTPVEVEAWLEEGYFDTGGLPQTIFALDMQPVSFHERGIGGVWPIQGAQISGSIPLDGLNESNLEALCAEDVFLCAEVETIGGSIPVKMKNIELNLLLENGAMFPLPLFQEPYCMESLGKEGRIKGRREEISISIKKYLVDNSLAINFAAELQWGGRQEDTFFLRSNDGFGLDLMCDIPLYLYGSGYRLRDTVPFVFEDKQENAEFEFMEFKTILKNAIPVDIDLNLTFLDEKKSPLFRLFKNRYVEGGSISHTPAMNVVSPGVSRFEDRLHKPDLERISGTRFVAIDAVFRTKDEELVKLYADDGGDEGYLEIRSGFRASLEVKDMLAK